MLYFQVFKRAFQIILLYLNKVKVATTLFQIIQYGTTFLPKCGPVKLIIYFRTCTVAEWHWSILPNFHCVKNEPRFLEI